MSIIILNNILNFIFIGLIILDGAFYFINGHGSRLVLLFLEVDIKNITGTLGGFLCIDFILLGIIKKYLTFYWLGYIIKKLSKKREYIAGWSSLVARRAHNPKVVGSNPSPATIRLSLDPIRVQTLFLYAQGARSVSGI